MTNRFLSGGDSLIGGQGGRKGFALYWRLGCWHHAFRNMPLSKKDQPENMPPSIFPEILRSELERNGMKQQELAALVGCTQSDVSRWLKGRIPSGDKLVALASAMGCSADYLITGIRAGPESVVREEPPDIQNWKKRALDAEKKLASIRSILESNRKDNGL